MQIRIIGSRKQVTNALTLMLREVWAYSHMDHRQIGQYAYLACLLQSGELLPPKFTMDKKTHRASTWARRFV